MEFSGMEDFCLAKGPPIITYARLIMAILGMWGVFACVMGGCAMDAVFQIRTYTPYMAKAGIHCTVVLQHRACESDLEADPGRPRPEHY